MAKARRKKRDKPIGVNELASRYERGLDLWTGEPLQGEDAREWLRTFYGKDEEGQNGEWVAGIVSVVGDRVLVRAKNGDVHLLKPKPNVKTKAAERPVYMASAARST